MEQFLQRQKVKNLPKCIQPTTEADYGDDIPHAVYEEEEPDYFQEGEEEGVNQDGSKVVEVQEDQWTKRQEALRRAEMQRDSLQNLIEIISNTDENSTDKAKVAEVKKELLIIQTTSAGFSGGNYAKITINDRQVFAKKND